MLLNDIIETSRRDFARNVALIFRDQPVTYAELGAQVDAVAAGLASLGIAQGDRIGLLLPNCPPFIAGYFAAARIGAVTVPANPMLKPAELEYMWGDAEVKLVVTAPPLLPNVQAARRGLPALKHVVSIGDREESPGADVTLADLAPAAGRPDRVPAARGPASENDCAVIIYTSGTTGRPKGAMLSHKNLTTNVAQVRAAIDFTEHDRFITALPLFHAFAATVCMNTALSAGCASLLMESFAPARTLEIIEKHRATVLPCVPAMFAALLGAERESRYDLSSLRLIVSGGAPLPSQTLTAIEDRFLVPVLEGDGPTECSPVTSVTRPDGIRKVGSVGLPLDGVQIAIFDEADRPLLTGHIGEIVVRGDNVMLGYLNQPDATAEAMRGGWYHTGDLGSIDEDGYVYIVDRKKDMIITSGLNVYPREVEEILLSHEAVVDAAVIGLPDGMRGEEVTAVVVSRPESGVTDRDIIGFCRERIANYKAPRKVLFRDSLPRGGTGKVLKRLLKKELENEVSDTNPG